MITHQYINFSIVNPFITDSLYERLNTISFVISFTTIMQMYRGIIRSALRRSHLRVSRTTVNVASQCGTKSAFEIQNHQKLAASSNLFMISSRNFSNIHLTPTTPELYLQETTDVFSSIVVSIFMYNTLNRNSWMVCLLNLVVCIIFLLLQDRLEADDIDGTFENEVDFSVRRMHCFF